MKMPEVLSRLVKYGSFGWNIRYGVLGGRRIGYIPQLEFPIAFAVKRMRQRLSRMSV